MQDGALDRFITEAEEARVSAERLASNHAMEMGAALVRRDRAGEAILGMAEAGAPPEDVMAGLVMAGLARRVIRIRDRLPTRRRSASVVYEVFDRSHLTTYPD